MDSNEVLRDKTILLLSPSFFSYEQSIKRKMEEMGATVYLFDERAVTSAFSRALLSIAPWLFIRKTRRYYKSIASAVANIEFDYILIVKCDMIDSKTLILLRHSFKKAKLCLYLWDSKKNIKGIDKKINLFDYVSSFDRFDCINDTRMTFRPLFYISDNGGRREEKKSDLCFCGTIHTDRYFVLKSLTNEASANGLTVNTFAYLQAKFMFHFYKMFGKGFKKAKKSEFSFEKKSIDEILKMENESDVVLDIQDPKQTGLTMRTIEMIGANKRFITTNKDIENYDFYDKDNILIINRKNPHLDLNFFGKEYKKIPEDIYEKYSIYCWILDVLGERQ